MTIQSFFKSHQTSENFDIIPAGKGFSSDRTLRRHVLEMESFIINKSNGDVQKQFQLVAAINKRILGDKRFVEKSTEACSIIQESLKNFTDDLKKRFKGRYPNHVRATQQAVCAAVAGYAKEGQLSKIAEATGFKIEALSAGRARLQAFMYGDEDTLFDVRGKLRSDTMEQAYIDLATSVWISNTRESERTNDCVRRPGAPASEPKHRIHFLSKRVIDIHEDIMREGEKHYPGEFHSSVGFTMRVKPFFVKPVKRSECFCPYHLRFDLNVKSLYYYQKKLRDSFGCTCEFPLFRNAMEFRHAYICPKLEDSIMYHPDCKDNKCERCKDFRLVQICQEALPMFPTIKWERYQNIEYQTKNGEVKTKKDFVRVETTFDEFYETFKKEMPFLLQHHENGKWPTSHTT